MSEADLTTVCPLCGQTARVLWREPDTLCGHMREPSRGRLAYMVPVCEAGGLTLADAAAIRAMRDAGGERLRLAAHP